jgi:predicted SprT family Zn-dependent metalloprotease
MRLADARTLGEALIAEYHLADSWRFTFDRAKVRFGVCRFDSGTISLSRDLTLANDAAKVEDVIRHEIAHAIAGRTAGHGPRWVAACRETGAEPTRCYQRSEVTAAPHPFVIACPNGCVRVPRYKRPRAGTSWGCRRCGAQCSLEVVDSTVRTV